MSKIISINGQYAQSLSDLKLEGFENQLALLYINSEFITSIYEDTITRKTKEFDSVKKVSDDKVIIQKVTCISRKGELNNIYTNQTIKKLIEIINN